MKLGKKNKKITIYEKGGGGQQLNFLRGTRGKIVKNSNYWVRLSSFSAVTHSENYVVLQIINNS